MWYISAVLLWSFFMAFYHSIPQIWVGLLLLCYSLCTDPPPLVPFTCKHTHASLHHGKYPHIQVRFFHWTYKTSRNCCPTVIFILERFCRRESAADSRWLQKKTLTFSQLLDSGFGCRLLVLVQWFVFPFWSFDDHTIIFFLYLCIVENIASEHCLYI